ncbi:A/G-specific adenine glycosylase [Ruminococcaceae bacterium OttesenSCG-928-A16]|nr:A/G-specific adenine glycosylase [Ruminococcaceae bacterium OttesenSCG-928-A16]
MPELAPIAAPLLAWYHQNRRILPFREDPTPYHIWVSEIMLQQTRVTAALPYYHRFITELPTIAALANCKEEKLHKLWQGLGYYNRVRNLQKAAKVVVAEYGGELPANYELLKKLPGIGEYTAGAIASIAFGLPQVAVDGNVLRVFSRLLASKADIAKPETKKVLSVQVQAQQPPQEAGDYNQALMELGALVCLPGTPNCEACPLAQLCHGYKQGIAASLPCKAAAKPKTVLPVCVLVVRQGQQVLLYQRPKKGLLAGLWGPLTLEGKYTLPQIKKELATRLPGAQVVGPLPKAEHVFTHRVWQLYGWLCELPPGTPAPQGAVLATAQQVQSQYSVPNAFKTYLPYLLAAGTPKEKAKL